MSWDDGLTGTARSIAATNNSPLRVMAGPGTGKSFAMKRRVARLLESGQDPAPGWRAAVDQRDKVQMRGRFIEYWISLFKRHRFEAASRVPLVTTDSNVPLYRLVFLSRHPFPRGLWDALDTKGQPSLFG